MLEPQEQGIVLWKLDWHLQVEPPLTQEPMRAIQVRLVVSYPSKGCWAEECLVVIQQLESGSVWPEAMGARALAVR